MAGDDVTAELVADAKRALEVEARADLPRAGVGDRQRLGRRLDVEPRAVAIRLPRDDRQADAGAG